MQRNSTKKSAVELKGGMVKKFTKKEKKAVILCMQVHSNAY